MRLFHLSFVLQLGIPIWDSLTQFWKSPYDRRLERLNYFFLDQFEPIKALKCDEAPAEATEEAVNEAAEEAVNEPAEEATNEAAHEAAEEDEATPEVYRFVVPVAGWSSYATGYYPGHPWTSDLELGQSFEVSGLCNPNFILPYLSAKSCEEMASEGFCTRTGLTRRALFFGNYNANGILETPLQCPQCGCGAKGAANLNYLSNPTYRPSL